MQARPWSCSSDRSRRARRHRQTKMTSLTLKTKAIIKITMRITLIMAKGMTIRQEKKVRPGDSQIPRHHPDPSTEEGGGFDD